MLKSANAVFRRLTCLLKDDCLKASDWNKMDATATRIRDLNMILFLLVMSCVADRADTNGGDSMLLTACTKHNNVTARTGKLMQL